MEYDTTHEESVCCDKKCNLAKKCRWASGLTLEQLTQHEKKFNLFLVTDACV